MFRVPPHFADAITRGLTNPFRDLPHGYYLERRTEINFRRFARGVLRDLRHAFQPWQGVDKLRAEVLEARARAPRLGWAPREWTWKWVKFENETKAEWLRRVDGNDLHEL